jgi:hypothetical protein
MLLIFINSNQKNPTLFNNIKSVHIPTDKIWKPVSFDHYLELRSTNV